jgi:outer membrane receptor for ferrienterochelin and colicins
MKPLMCALLLFLGFAAHGQGRVEGRVLADSTPVPYATVTLAGTRLGALTDTAGRFLIREVPAGSYQLKVSAVGFESAQRQVTVHTGTSTRVELRLARGEGGLDEVVVTGTMREMKRLESPIPVEVFTPRFFRQNPTPSLFEAVGLINGIQPQLNCNICNTGDIHINGMEGPYTMVLIDGMPIVSALASVYGLNGIPNSLVERLEVVKGPASSLYGSEAMGGIINVITKDPINAPILSADIFGTSWGEYNADASMKFRKGKTTGMLGINYFNYSNPIDKNRDGFTDMTLQDRTSIFSKWSFRRKEQRAAAFAARYVYEDRWGGQMNWNKRWRGSDSIYGESIYTNRVELTGMYQLPLREKIFTQFSWNWHNQDSWYGITPYMATQQVAFAQAYWDRQLGKAHSLLLGGALRYTWYDDNTPGTASADTLRPANRPMQTPLPGVFIQDEWTFHKKHKLLAGYRYDYDRHHGSIHSPRLAYKWSPDPNHTLRASFGTGYRVVNLFTEDHAALSGAREVVIMERLNPERSWNSNLNYVWQIPTEACLLDIDITGFYSYFNNKIVGDFDTDPRKIIYDNLKGHAVSRGASLNLTAAFRIPLRLMAGATYMDVYLMEDGGTGALERVQQLHAPRWSGNFLISYTLPERITIDFTGKWNGPMRLPVLPGDYRPEYAPWHCIANLQLARRFGKGLEVYGGVKNLFNFVPKDPIMRPFDPFNKTADDPVSNPHGYTFDPSYNYASLQGARMFLGLRYQLRR